jgi:hypothetical protein
MQGWQSTVAISDEGSTDRFNDHLWCNNINIDVLGDYCGILATSKRDQSSWVEHRSGF